MNNSKIFFDIDTLEQAHSDLNIGAVHRVSATEFYELRFNFGLLKDHGVKKMHMIITDRTRTGKFVASFSFWTDQDAYTAEITEEQWTALNKIAI